MTYTNEQVIAAIKKAVEAKGQDYVYPRGLGGRCDYSRDGEPSCIVGHVFNYLDTELFEKVVRSERHLGFSPQLLAIESIREDLTSAQLHALRKAQSIQDAGGTWGEALAAFLLGKAA